MKTRLIAALFGIMILFCLSANVYAAQINTLDQDQAVASQMSSDQIETQYFPPYPPPRPYPPYPPYPPPHRPPYPPHRPPVVPPVIPPPVYF